MGAAKRFFEDVVVHYDGDECLLWPYASIKGYGAMRVRGETVYVCRRICDGEPTPDKPNVLHSCGRGAHGCVTKRHLRYGSQKTNLADREVHGTVNRGKRNGRVVLSEAQVKDIVACRRKETYDQLAERYSVSKGCIRDILTGRNWSWLTGL